MTVPHRVRADGHRSERIRVVGVLVDRVEDTECITEEDFAEAKRERVDAAERRYGPVA